MTDSVTDRYGEILEDILGDEKLRRCRRMGLPDENLLNLYHNNFDRDQEQFRKAVDNMLENQQLKQVYRDIEQDLQKLIEEFEMKQEIQQNLGISVIKEYQGEEQ